MRYRKALSNKRKDRQIFSNTANKVHKKNIITAQRGGHRI